MPSFSPSAQQRSPALFRPERPGRAATVTSPARPDPVRVDPAASSAHGRPRLGAAPQDSGAWADPPGDGARARPAGSTEDRAMTRAWWAYLIVVGVVSLGYAAGPAPLSSGPVFNLLGLSAVLAIVVGARVHRPRRVVAWHWFAAGQALFVAGDVLAYNYEALFERPLPFPSAADPFSLAVYPALVCGLFVLVRPGGGRGDRAGVIDALIVSAGVATVSWVTLMAPYVQDASQPVSARLVSIAYPLGDLLVLNMLVRLAIDRERRTSSHYLLLCAIGALLVTDSVYTWRLVHGGYDPGQWLDLGWVAFYALLGASALHPSMRRLSEPTLVVERRLSRPRLPLLASAALLAPGLLAV